MKSSIKLGLLNLAITLIALVVSLSLALVVKTYVVTSSELPLIIFFILSFFLYNIIKDLLCAIFNKQIVKLYDEATQGYKELLNKTVTK